MQKIPQPSIGYSGEYRTGGELYRVTIYQYDQSQKLLGTYEVWSSREAIEDRLGTSGPITTPQLHQFAIDFYKKWMEETNDLPQENGAFITSRGVTYGDYTTFPHSVGGLDPMVRTNISLPKSLYRWLRSKSIENKRSISEIIRLSLVEHKSKIVDKM